MDRVRKEIADKQDAKTTIERIVNKVMNQFSEAQAYEADIGSSATDIFAGCLSVAVSTCVTTCMTLAQGDQNTAQSILSIIAVKAAEHIDNPEKNAQNRKRIELNNNIGVPQ